MTVAANVSQTLATLNGIEAQLSTLAQNSLDENAQKAFHESMITINQIKTELQNRRKQLDSLEPQYKES